MTESFFTTLKTAAEFVGVRVTDNQCEKLYKFYETVVEYNKNVNLTAITDEKEFIVKHIVDSISAAKFIKENADVVVARAVGQTNILLELSIPLLKKHGVFINYKGKDLSDVETAKTAEAALNAKKTEVYNFCLPFDAGERNIVVYEKIEDTPRIYPRKFGTIKKNPL